MSGWSHVAARNSKRTSTATPSTTATSVASNRPDSRAKTVCKYFLSNACTRGAECPFSHVKEAAGGAKPDNICRYYLMGNCSYGSRCRYDHVKPKVQPSNITPTTTPAVQKAQPFATKEGSRGLIPLQKSLWVRGGKQAPMNPTAPAFGTEEGVGLAEEEPDPTAKQTVTSLPYAAAAHVAIGRQIPLSCSGSKSLHHTESYSAEIPNAPIFYEAQSVEERSFYGPPSDIIDQLTEESNKMSLSSKIDDKSKTVECSICMEVVYEKPRKSDRRFGILPGCSHPFCLNCIRVWRQSSDTGNEIVRTCPICRTASYFVVPSASYVERGPDKEALIAAYRSKTQTIHCKHFDFGKGTCPFGNSCFYKHEHRDGTREEYSARFRADASGHVGPVRQVFISDFLAHRDTAHQ